VMLRLGKRVVAMVGLELLAGRGGVPHSPNRSRSVRASPWADLRSSSLHGQANRALSMKAAR
jgi:hypothetical protein